MLFLQLNFELDILRLNAAQLDCQIIDLLRLLPELSFEVYHGLSTDFIDTVLPYLFNLSNLVLRNNEFSLAVPARLCEL